MAYTFVLFVYFSTFSASSGMATSTAEFHNQVSCEQAAEVVKKNFSGLATSVRTVCVPK